MAKKTKRKIAHPNCRCSGSSISSTKESISICAEISIGLNARYFGGRLRGYKVVWGRRRKRRPKEYLFSAPSRKKIESSGSIRCWTSRSFRLGSSATFSITKCCTRWCRTKSAQRAPPGPYRRILRARARVSRLSARPPLGGRKPRAVFAVGGFQIRLQGVSVKRHSFYRPKGGV